MRSWRSSVVSSCVCSADWKDRGLDELQRILQQVQTRNRPETAWTEQGAKTNLALDALRSARKELRKTPSAAVQLLATGRPAHAELGQRGALSTCPDPE